MTREEWLRQALHTVEFPPARDALAQIEGYILQRALGQFMFEEPVMSAVQVLHVLGLEIEVQHPWYDLHSTTPLLASDPLLTCPN